MTDEMNNLEPQGIAPIEEFNFEGDFETVNDSVELEVVDNGQADTVASQMDLAEFAGRFSDKFEIWPPASKDNFDCQIIKTNPKG